MSFFSCQVRNAASAPLLAPRRAIHRATHPLPKTMSTTSRKKTGGGGGRKPPQESQEGRPARSACAPVAATPGSLAAAARPPKRPPRLWPAIVSLARPEPVRRWIDGLPPLPAAWHRRACRSARARLQQSRGGVHLRQLGRRRRRRVGL